MRLFSGLVFLVVLLVGCSRSKPENVEVKTEENTPNVPTPSKADPLKAAMTELRASSPQRRLAGIHSIVNNFDETPELFAGLIEALKEPTSAELGKVLPKEPYSTREAVVMALLRMEARGEKELLEKGLPILEAGLKDKQPNVREHTLAAIALIGPKAKSLAPALIEFAATEKVPLVREAAFGTLRQIKDIPVKPLLDLLVSTDKDVASDAAGALVWLQPKGKEALEPLMAGLKHSVTFSRDNPETTAYLRNKIALAISGLGPVAIEAIPVLIEAVRKTTEEDLNKSRTIEDSGAILALRKLGKPAVPALLPLLKDKGAIVRWQAVVILGNIGPDAREVLPDIEKLVETEMEEFEVLSSAVFATLSLGGDPAKGIARLVELLGNPQPEIRRSVIRTLSRMGRAAGASPVPGLLGILQDTADAREIGLIIRTLRNLGRQHSKKAIPILIERMKLLPSESRVAICELLGDAGPGAAEAMPALLIALKDEDGPTKEAAVAAITAIGPAARDTLPEFLKLLKSPIIQPSNRFGWLRAVGAIQADAVATVPVLLELFPEPDPMHRLILIETMGMLSGGTPEGNAKLLAVLTKTSERLNIRAAAARSLAALRATEAIPAFEQLLDPKNSEIRVWAAAGLLNMDKDRDAAIKILNDALTDRSQAGLVNRLNAIDACGSLGAKVSPLLSNLNETLKDRNPTNPRDLKKTGEKIRDRAIQAYVRLGANAAPALDVLGPLLADTEPAFRRKVLQVIAQIGPPAKRFDARLKEIIRTDPILAEDAQETLDRVLGVS